MNDRLRTSLIVVITCVWAANLTAPILIRDYSPPESIHVVFMAIVGVLTATYPKRNGNGGGNGRRDGQP